MLQFWIATLPILLANSTKLPEKLTEELERSLKKNPNTLNPEMPLWSDSSHKSLCALKLSNNILLLEDLPLET